MFSHLICLLLEQTRKKSKRGSIDLSSIGKRSWQSDENKLKRLFDGEKISSSPPPPLALPSPRLGFFSWLIHARIFIGWDSCMAVEAIILHRSNGIAWWFPLFLSFRAASSSNRHGRVVDRAGQNNRLLVARVFPRHFFLIASMLITNDARVGAGWDPAEKLETGLRSLMVRNANGNLGSWKRRWMVVGVSWPAMSGSIQTLSLSPSLSLIP